MDKNLTYNLSIRLFTDVKCFGPGIAQLLHRVQRLHSLRAAAADMQMAYSKAWTIIKNCEREMGFPLLSSTTGGRGGGGAVLTEEGTRLLEAYDAFCTELRGHGDALFREKFKPWL
jgi:molybdate transport repressor ModE-like protein